MTIIRNGHQWRSFLDANTGCIVAGEYPVAFPFSVRIVGEWLVVFTQAHAELLRDAGPETEEKP